MLRRRRTLPMAVIIAALALSGCGAAEVPPAVPVAPPAGAAPAPGGGSGTGGYGSSADGAQPAAPEAPKEASLTAREAAGLGTVVSDVGGFTLYRFEDDSPNPPASTCVDECAAKWPPVVVDRAGKLTLEGVDKSQVGLVERQDGTVQLTVAGWPVYRFTGDRTPGSAEGQGVGGVWFAITPDGKKATATP